MWQCIHNGAIQDPNEPMPHLSIKNVPGAVVANSVLGQPQPRGRSGAHRPGMIDD